MKIAVQLYTLRDDLAKDFEGTIRRVANAGYDGVEFAGLYDKTADEIKALLKECKLEPISAHVGIKDAAKPELLETYKKIGCKFMIVPWSPAPTEENYRSIIADIKTATNAMKTAGFITGYHNHDFEFNTVFGGERYADIIYREIPDMCTQFDCCWVQVGGGDPVEYINKYAKRSKIIHIKDFVKKGVSRKPLYDLIGTAPVTELEGDDTFDQRPVGYGVLDVYGIIEAAKKAGTEWIVVELDRPQKNTTAMWCVEKSMEFLKKVFKK